eukprot:353203-Chlamydomonas_euryale.AAC.2
MIFACAASALLWRCCSCLSCSLRASGSAAAATTPAALPFASSAIQPPAAARSCIRNDCAGFANCALSRFVLVVFHLLDLVVGGFGCSGTLWGSSPAPWCGWLSGPLVSVLLQCSTSDAMQHPCRTGAWTGFCTSLPEKPCDRLKQPLEAMQVAASRPPSP